jgi:hypothetical protein
MVLSGKSHVEIDVAVRASVLEKLTNLGEILGAAVRTQAPLFVVSCPRLLQKYKKSGVRDVSLPTRHCDLFSSMLTNPPNFCARPADQLEISASATRWAIKGGTALPTCRPRDVRPPAKVKLAGNV